MPELDAGPHAADGHHPPEDVAERQEQQSGGGVLADGLEDGVQQLHRVVHLGEEVGVGDHASLGLPGGAGGVDEGGDGVRGAGGPAVVDHRVRDAFPGLDQPGHRAGVEFPQVGQPGQVAAFGADEPGLRGVLDGAGHGPGVLDDPARLEGGGGGVDRYGDQAGGPAGEVEQGPLVGRTGHDGEPVALPEPFGDQALGHGEHLGRELCGRDVVPDAVLVLAGEHRLPGGLPGVDEGEVPEGSPVRGARQRGHPYLADHSVDHGLDGFDRFYGPDRPQLGSHGALSLARHECYRR